MVETLRKRKKKVSRTKKKGGGINLLKARATSDYISVNNHKIPDEIAAKRFILNNLYGLNGKVLQLPYPGEIFYANDSRDLQSAYVCVQSCIAGLKSPNDFNLQQQLISKGASTTQNDCNLKLYNKHLGLSYINYVLRANMSPSSSIFKAYKRIMDMNETKEIDLNSRTSFVKVYDTIKNIIDELDLKDIKNFSRGYASQYVVYGVPLIKYTPEMFSAGLCTPQDVANSQRVMPFLLQDIRDNIRVKGIQKVLKQYLKKGSNLDQEDSYNNRFGVLDLEDSNVIPYSKAYKGADVLLNEAADKVYKIATGDASPEDTTLIETSESEGDTGEKVETVDGETGEEGDDSDAGDSDDGETGEKRDDGETGEEGDDGDSDAGDSDAGEKRASEDKKVKLSLSQQADNLKKLLKKSITQQATPLKEQKIEDVIHKLKENYNNFAEKQKGTKTERDTKKAKEIIDMIFANDDKIQELIKGGKIIVYTNFILVNIKTKIKAVREGGRKAIGNLYFLDEKSQKFKIVGSKIDSRLRAIRNILDSRGTPKTSEKIAININPIAGERYIRVCYKHDRVDFWLSVFSTENKERISIKDSGNDEKSIGGGIYTRRVRKKTLRKRYNKGGGFKENLSKGAFAVYKGVRTAAKMTKKMFYDNAFTGQTWSNAILSRLRSWTSTRMVDIEMRRKNWNYRVGDTFLWLGNEYLYQKYQLTTIELKSFGLLNEKYGEKRDTTYLDSNTIQRLPIKGSYCTIIGYGTDILYASRKSDLSQEETVSLDEKYKNITEYENGYKHNNLLNGTTEKLLLHEKITSRIIRQDIAMKMKNPEADISTSPKYEWAYYEKDSDLYNESGKVIEDMQKREKTPNKCCYYIVESKSRDHLPSKTCKVYLDELQLWGQNYSRFSSYFRRMGRYIKKSFSREDNVTTQEEIERLFEESLKHYTNQLNDMDRDKYSKAAGTQAGGGPGLLDILNTEEQAFDNAQDALQGKSEKLDISDSGRYAPKKEAKILDHFPFLRSLPATLYAYITYYIINFCRDENDDPSKMLETFKKNLSKSNVVDEDIFYRYGSNLENFETFNHYYFSKKYIRNIFKIMGQSNESRSYRIIPRIFKDINSFQIEERNNMDVLYKSVVNTVDKYEISEKNKIRDIRPVGLNSKIIYNFFPKVHDQYLSSGENNPTDGEQITKYLEDIIQNNMNIRKIGDINKYGIDMFNWIKNNNAYANKFVETDRATYMSIPSLLNITPNTMKSRGDILLYSLGYYVFYPHSNYFAEAKNGNQSLFWHDRHISITDYNKSISTFPSLNIDQNKVDREKEKLNIIQGYLHAPIIFIVNRDKVYIPPIFYCISEVTLSFMKKIIPTINPEWSMVEFKIDKDNSDTNDSIDPIDIREYCLSFVEYLKKKKILYVKNVNLPNTSESLDGNSNRFTKFDNIHFNQYNSRKRVLPVTTTALNQARMIPWMNSLNKLSNNEGYIGEIDKKLEIKPSNIKPLNRIFGGLQTIDSSGVHFYDYEHIMNAIKYMQNVESETGTSTVSRWWQKSKEVIGEKISMDAIKMIGNFTGGSLFFQDRDISKNDIDKSVDNVNFFKYLFFKYSLDINLFKDWGKPTFIRWQKTQEQGTTLVLEPNMIMRLNNLNCIRMYNNTDLGLRKNVIYSYLKQIKVEMEQNESMKFDGALDDAFGGVVQVVTNAAKAKFAQDVMGPPSLNVNYAGQGQPQGQPPSFEPQFSGGTRKTFQKKKKKIGRRTRSKMKRTNQKMKRTSKKMKRTDKKNKKRTGKKKVYNP